MLDCTKKHLALPARDERTKAMASSTSSNALRVFHYNPSPPEEALIIPATIATASADSPNIRNNGGPATDDNVSDNDGEDHDEDGDTPSGSDGSGSSGTNDDRRPQHISAPPLARLPAFDNRFRRGEPQFYFYHVVDTRDASLRVQVLGPGLSFTFTHERARRHLSAGRIAAGLRRKTTGFLALVRTCTDSRNGHHSNSRMRDGDSTDNRSNGNGVAPPPPPPCPPLLQHDRTVLVWAESGHGAGRAGDMLDAAPGALPNGTWTRRAVRLAALLGLRTERPFDTMGLREGELDARARERLRGVFLASHVEVKLATHGVYALLHVFGLHRESRGGRREWRRQRQRRSPPNGVNTDGRCPERHRSSSSSRSDAGSSGGSLDLATLTRLRDARWDDGSRPRLEVYFSRRNCVPCGMFVRRLSEVIGVRIDLIWRERLTHVVYETRAGSGGVPRESNLVASRTAALRGSEGQRGSGMVDTHGQSGLSSSSQRLRPQHEADDDDDDVQMLDVVDLTGAAPRCCIDLTGEPSTGTAPPVWDLTKEGAESDDESAMGRMHSVGSAREAYMAAYLDGLAYCVGQLPQTTTSSSQCDDKAAEHAEEAWRAVRTAMVDFAKRMLLLRRASSSSPRLCATEGRLATDSSTQQETDTGEGRDSENGKSMSHARLGARARQVRTRPVREVNKPLPATPETQPPAWMMDADGEEEMWETDEPVEYGVVAREGTSAVVMAPWARRL
ncbi:hypothetical protein JDV02_002946 [Purpureocillium takamizusanense]|uniref:Uncharacterized protein n=1 Tax=Purpureocillium takamizusanense TaxID=2060973 RepID=A0A9Q8V8A2_9HYPO|nr:uncharacterized protein JDV02_002946 [Purpureocillium takamizusanense]UNI16518.1 hypothetical protein JDV02_002946 [Purpureocillium takamizusanense]